MLFPPEQVTTTDKGHGRIEVRTITILPVKPGQITFPFANQVFSIERIFSDFTGELLSSDKVFGVTSLAQERAGPYRILALNRGHWTIENKVHYVRDVTMGEDASRIRKGDGPRLMAIFRNLVLSLLRQTGVTNIAGKTLRFALDKNSLFKFAGIRGAIKN